VNRLVHQGCVWKKVQLQGEGSLITCAGLAGLKRLLVSLGVMQVSQVTMQGIILNDVPVSTRDRNITTLLRWAPELKLHLFQTVEGALSCVDDPDVMDKLLYDVHDTIPQGDYIFFPFTSSAYPSGPCCWVCLCAPHRDSSVSWLCMCSSDCLYISPLHRPTTTDHQLGAYSSLDLSTWMIFTYGPAAFTGSRKTSNTVDVLRVWQVSGDLSPLSRSVTQEQREATLRGMRTEEVHMVQVSRRWRATGPCNKLYVGWAGWAELKLNIGHSCCERCVCANKGGKPVPQQIYASLFEDLTNVQLARAPQASMDW